jgi:hypothetical protein
MRHHFACSSHSERAPAVVVLEVGVHPLGAAACLVLAGVVWLHWR